MKRTFAAAIALSPLLLLALPSFLMHACDQELPVLSKEEASGMYQFQWDRPGVRSRDCLTLFPDGSFVAVGLHDADPSAQTSGSWQLDGDSESSSLIMGNQETPIFKSKKQNVITIDFGEVVGGNNCVKR